MSDINVKSKGPSPGEALKLQREMEARSRAYAKLSQALLEGHVVGDQVTRLHKMIGGTVEEMSQAETELALQRMLALQNRLVRSTFRGIR